jgi:hypothetical protein
MGSRLCSPQPPGRRGGRCAAAVAGARGSEHNSWTAWTFTSTLRAVGPIRCLAGQSFADKERMSTFVLDFPPSQFFEFGHNKMGSLKIMHLPMNLGYPQRAITPHYTDGKALRHMGHTRSSSAQAG